MLLKRGADVSMAMTPDLQPDAACKVLLIAHGRRWTKAADDDEVSLDEMHDRMGGNQFIKEASFASMPSAELRAIMWRSPSLQTICAGDESVARESDGAAVRPALQAGDTVRVLDTEGDWEVARVLGDYVELAGREGTVPVGQVVVAGPCRRATWRGRRSHAAEAGAKSNVITQVLSRRGRISTCARSVVADSLSTTPSGQKQ